MDLLRALRYRGMLEEFEAQLKSNEYDSLSFIERFSLLVEAEYLRKQNSRIQLRNKKAGFAQGDACIEGIDYSLDRNINKDTILKLASCTYVSRHENILILGPSDSGKSYLGCALGNAACRRDIKVSYMRLADLFESLDRAETAGRLTKVFRFFATVSILVLDDFLLSVPTLKQVQILVELMEQRERTASTIICSQLAPRDWHKRIDEAIQANCIYSRLVPSAHLIELKGATPMRERYSTIGSD
ncbi:MAG: ATP-binding protein [Coriobacteriales bacterium]|nr:ATP-binding protein [Coriobacteriales bacterium]